MEISGGNPLFAEELVALVHERGGEALGNVPPSIEALLASRFDLLKPDERRLVERAAVVGAEFSREDVTALFAAETLANLSAHVLGLVGRDSFDLRVRLAARNSSASTTFWFGMPPTLVCRKRSRPLLRSRLADSLAGQPDAPDEIVGYHLQQAVRYLEELAPLDEHGLHTLAVRGGRKLASAAFRSSARGDFVTSAGLLERAASLLPADLPDRIEVLLQLGRAFLYAEELEKSGELFSDALEAARRVGERRLELHALLGLELMRLLIRPVDRLRLGLPGGSEGAKVLARTALTVFEEAGDDLGSARAWSLLLIFHSLRGEAVAALEAALRHGRSTMLGGRRRA